MRALLSALLLAALFSANAAADVIISNLPGNDLTSTFMNAPGGGSNGGGVFDSKAAGFAMPAGSAYVLDSVTLRLNFFSTTSVPVVEIRADAGGTPGGIIQTLAAPSFGVGAGSFDFTPTSPLTLAPSTTYWVTVWNNASAPNSFQWFANSPSITPTGIATHVGYRFSNGGPPPTGNSTTFNSYAVNASIPEPAVLAGFGVGALSLGLRRRRSA